MNRSGYIPLVVFIALITIVGGCITPTNHGQTNTSATSTGTKNVSIVLITNSSEGHIFNIQGGSDLGTLTSLNITVDDAQSTSFIGPFSQNEQLYWIDGPLISQRDNVTVIGHFTDGSIQLLIPH